MLRVLFGSDVALEFEDRLYNVGMFLQHERSDGQRGKFVKRYDSRLTVGSVDTEALFDAVVEFDEAALRFQPAQFRFLFLGQQSLRLLLARLCCDFHLISTFVRILSTISHGKLRWKQIVVPWRRFGI